MMIFNVVVRSPVTIWRGIALANIVIALANALVVQLMALLYLQQQFLVVVRELV